jgi:hypothetical protein
VPIKLNARVTRFRARERAAERAGSGVGGGVASVSFDRRW